MQAYSTALLLHLEHSNFSLKQENKKPQNIHSVPLPYADY